MKKNLRLASLKKFWKEMSKSDMQKRKLLLATQNPAKIIELRKYLETLPFEIFTLQDLDEEITTPEEPFDELEYNAIAKAKYYAEKTGLLSLADDSGLFIDALGDWPGVQSARIGKTDDERRSAVLEKMKGIKDRTASFRASLAIFDPENNISHTVTRRENGLITEEAIGPERPGFPYDQIFWIEEMKKNYSELSIEEKNRVSHRAKAMNEMQYILKKNYDPRHIVVPCGFLIRDGKLYMQKRNEPHRPAYHDKWEFPGGGVELGETLEQTVVREVKEEAGYDVEIICMLQKIRVEAQQYATFSYQVYLIPFVCKIVGGEGKISDHEVLETRWFDLDDVLNHELLGTNAEFYKSVVDELKEVVKKHNL